MTVVSIMKQPSRREQARQDKRQRITRAAAELFRRQGFEATTTEQIAKCADVAKGTIFLYAPTKLQLLLLVYEEDLAELVAQALAAVDPAAPVVETLVQIFTPFLHYYEQDLDLARRFVREQLFLTNPEERPIHGFMALLGGLTELIRQWQAAGQVQPDVDALLAAQNSFALYFAVLAAWLGGRLTTEQRDERLRASLALHWRGITEPLKG